MIILANNANSAIGKLRIIDGDTIVLNGEKIRLKGMDAPEMKQICWDNTKKEIECGKIAKEKLENIIGSNKLECDIKGKDRYGRSLGYCYAGNININKEMVRRGYAVAYVEYDKSFAADEYMAKKEKLGFWNGTFERPQDWRKKSKQSRKKKNTKPKYYMKNVGGIEKVDFLCEGDLERAKVFPRCSDQSAEEIDQIKDEYIKYKKILEQYIVKKGYMQFNEKTYKDDIPLDINEVSIAIYDIDGDGEKEILFNILEKGYCGSAGCYFGILKKGNKGEWNALIMPIVYSDGIFISKNITPSGYRDFIFSGRWGKGNVWRWNGDKYDYYKKIHNLRDGTKIIKKKIIPTLIKFRDIKGRGNFNGVIKENFPIASEGEKALCI